MATRISGTDQRLIYNAVYDTNKVDSYVVPDSDENRAKIVENRQVLQEIFSGATQKPVTKEKLLVISDVLFKYAKQHYGQYNSTCFGLTLVALNIELQRLGIFDLHFDFPNELVESKALIDGAFFQSFRKAFFSSNMTAICQQIETSQDLGTYFHLAEMASWMLKTIGTSEKFNPEIAQLHLFAKRLFTASGFSKALSELNEMEALTAHIESCQFEAKGDLVQAEACYKKSMTNSNFLKDQFLLANLRYRSSFFVAKIDINAARGYCSKALQFAEKCRGQRDSNDRLLSSDYNSKEFGLYDLQMARLLKDSNSQESRKHCERALETFHQYPNESQSLIQQVAEIKSSF